MSTHQKAKRIANEHLRAEDSTLVAVSAKRDHKYGVWVVSYVDPAYPTERLDGGALVVTDEGAVHDLGSPPDAAGQIW